MSLAIPAPHHRSPPGGAPLLSQHLDPSQLLNWMALSPEASSPPAQASARNPRVPPARAAARPASSRAAEPFARATKGATGFRETAVVSQEQRLGPHTSQATHFYPAPPLRSGKNAGLGHRVLLFFAKGRASAEAGIVGWGGGRVLRWALPSAAPKEGPGLSGIPHAGSDLQKEMFACCRVRIYTHGAK